MTAPRTPPEPFHEFLLAEYNNLAQAFFSAATGITQFFQYYLLALGVPITAVGVAVKVTTGTIDFRQLVASDLSTPLGWFFALVGVVGMCMAIYIINLRLDALLYARAVNGIRKYFYERSGVSLEDERAYRVLPDRTDTPPYYEWRFFFPVVVAFAIMNSAYLGLGVALFGFSEVVVALGAAAFMLVHFAVYGRLTKHREMYLRTDDATKA